MPKQHNALQDGWVDCQPGAIHEVVVSVRNRHWRRRAISGGVTVSISILLLAAAGWSLRTATSIESQACATISKLLPQYAEGLLARDEMARVKIHLENCEYCRRKFASMETAGVSQLQPELRLRQAKARLAFSATSP